MQLVNKMAAKDVDILPSAPKMVRLGFHSCVKYVFTILVKYFFCSIFCYYRYKDGEGGCNGCLDWKGVGYRYEDGIVQYRDDFNMELFDNILESDNNGLEGTVEVLEALYTDRKYPKNMAPKLEMSLKESGKSRADLWAFAAITAIEYGIESNNAVCNGTFNNNPKKQCNQEKGMDECQVKVPEGALRFQTGRVDCGADYKTDRAERHPNIMGNGAMTTDFFKSEFGFSPRQSVAIMGAHTMGRLHPKISLFRYMWTTFGTELFNNGYYKNIVGEDRWSWDDPDCTKLGTKKDKENNTPPKTRWLTSVREQTKNGGPVFWVHESYRGPNCETKYQVRTKGRANPFGDLQFGTKMVDGKKVATYDHCCEGPNLQTLVEDIGKGDITKDDNPDGGCERWTFNWGIDDMALSCEMGMYYDFQVTEDGIPYGCDGLNYFNTDSWFLKRKNGNSGKRLTWSSTLKDGVKWVRPFDSPEGPKLGQFVRSEPLCGMNRMDDGFGNELHTVFEEYAKDQDAWLKDFFPAYEQMLANGYSRYRSQCLKISQKVSFNVFYF